MKFNIHAGSSDHDATMTSSSPREHNIVHTNFNVDTPTGSAPVNASPATRPLDVPKESSHDQNSNSANTATPVSEAERTPCNIIPAHISN